MVEPTETASAKPRSRSNGRSRVKADQAKHVAVPPAPVKTRLFVTLHHGRSTEDTSLDLAVFQRIRDLLEAAVARLSVERDAKDVELDLWLDSPGGSADVAFKLVLLFRSYASWLRVVVPDYAKSAATLIAIAADELYMAPAAELGPLDAQIHYEQGGITMSALDISDSLDQLFRTAITMTVSGGAVVVRSTGLSRKEILAGMLDFVAKFMTPLVAQLDPSMIHRSTSQLKVAQDYADRLILMRTNKNRPGPDPVHLVSHYPSHRFVIGPEEAEHALGLPVQPLAKYQYKGLVDRIFREFERHTRDVFGVYTEDDLKKMSKDTENGHEKAF